MAIAAELTTPSTAWKRQRWAARLASSAACTAASGSTLITRPLLFVAAASAHVVPNRAPSSSTVSPGRTSASAISHCTHSIPHSVAPANVRHGAVMLRRATARPRGPVAGPAPAAAGPASWRASAMRAGPAAGPAAAAR